MELTEHLVSSIRNWLSVNVPEFINIRIADHGKYLGWYLGKEDVSRSFEAPLLKFQDRVQEVVEGSAPMYLAIQRYNQRAVSVLSYVSQFAVSDADLSSLQQTALHKVFRLPRPPGKLL